MAEKFHPCQKIIIFVATVGIEPKGNISYCLIHALSACLNLTTRGVIKRCLTKEKTDLPCFIAIYYDICKKIPLKGTAQRKLRWVKNSTNYLALFDLIGRNWFCISLSVYCGNRPSWYPLLKWIWRRSCVQLCYWLVMRVMLTNLWDQIPGTQFQDQNHERWTKYSNNNQMQKQLNKWGEQCRIELLKYRITNNCCRMKQSVDAHNIQ